MKDHIRNYATPLLMYVVFFVGFLEDGWPNVRIVLGIVDHSVPFLAWFLTNYKFAQWILLLMVFVVIKYPPNTTKSKFVSMFSILGFFLIDFFDTHQFVFVRGMYIPEIGHKEYQTLYLISFSVFLLIVSFKERIWNRKQ